LGLPTLAKTLRTSAPFKILAGGGNLVRQRGAFGHQLRSSSNATSLRIISLYREKFHCTATPHPPYKISRILPLKALSRTRLVHAGRQGGQMPVLPAVHPGIRADGDDRVSLTSSSPAPRQGGGASAGLMYSSPPAHVASWRAAMHGKGTGVKGHRSAADPCPGWAS
jgi:hypothetical protein